MLEEEFVLFEDFFAKHATETVLFGAFLVKSDLHQASLLTELAYHQVFVLVKPWAWIDSLLNEVGMTVFGVLFHLFLRMLSFFGISHLVDYLLWLYLLFALIIYDRFWLSSVVLINALVWLLYLLSLLNGLIFENWDQTSSLILLLMVLNLGIHQFFSLVEKGGLSEIDLVLFNNLDTVVEDVSVIDRISLVKVFALILLIFLLWLSRIFNVDLLAGHFAVWLLRTHLLQF